MKRIFTIGYEGATVPEFLAALTKAGVEQVIDVRQLPLSRRPGFSKTPLAAELAEVGIGYIHLKALGTPKPGRDAAKKGDRATLEKVYAGQLELPEAQAEGAKMLGLAEEKRSALLCFERDPAMCHRTLLMDAVGEGGEVVEPRIVEQLFAARGLGQFNLLLSLGPPESRAIRLCDICLGRPITGFARGAQVDDLAHGPLTR